MPPKIIYTDEAILTAALETVRKHGPDSLSARAVAGEMNGSTQPIYRVFPSIGLLEEAVIHHAKEIALDYMIKEEDTESAFLSIGLGYLRFFREEPKLYSLLFMSGKVKWDLTSSDSPLRPLIEKMRRDPELAGLPSGRLEQLFRDMFIYTHGLCTLTTINTDKTDHTTMRDSLREMGGNLIAMTILKEKQGIDIEDMMRRYHQ